MTEEPRTPAAVSDGRDKRGRFAKGNPGKPHGSRHRATKAVETLLDGRAEQLTEKAVELALAGDTTALRLCLERLAPPRKDAPVSVDVPPVEGAGDLLGAGAAILNAASTGELTPSEAQAMASLLQHHAKLVELHELEERITQLEKERNK